ncbi:pyrokinin-1 receptor isoform X2 [Cephus cinctus]|uniref:Pyrokinin-1 receptor isoform X2 n=1 Tax=Cephus cinctus TaxID=211228 RepID=A0AAJ7RDH9_CEPCN|nr:pyrokinin-1 receptor isoform X2 [Cephus cinctus]
MIGRMINDSFVLDTTNEIKDYQSLTRNISLASREGSNIFTDFKYSNSTEEFLNSDDSTRRDPLYIVLPITIIYIAIFFTGVIGNISTCVVIARNKSMHTATNYYLFSLAISDLLLLISGLPPEMYCIWSQFPYVFGEVFCIIQSFAAETSANATVLTITAFTVERYVAICHPFISHTMSKLSRAVKFVIAIWLLALGLAIPQAIQFGIVHSDDNGTVIEDSARCTVKWVLIQHAFEISTMLFFVVPMTIITVLYVLIAIKLRSSRLLTAVKRTSISNSLNHGDSSRGKGAAQRNVIRMLVAVVVAFFICWAPFHAQRLLAVYAQGNSRKPHPALVIVYTIVTYVSGILYYLSTTVNPLLYNIMSNKFREAFKSMLSQNCRRRRSPQKTSPRRPTYSALSHYPKHTNHPRNHRPSASISISDETQRLAAANNVQNCNEVVTCDTAPKQTELVQPEHEYQPGILAERLRLGTKNLFTSNHQKSTKSIVRPEVASAPPILQSQPSIDSANTISNSSLQDLDETEFSGLELARYMGQLNFDLIT